MPNERDRPLSTPSPASASSTPYARAIAYACAVSAAPDLVPAAERHLPTLRRNRHRASKWNRLDLALRERAPRPRRCPYESPGQVQIHVAAGDDRAVDAAQVAGDPLAHARARSHSSRRRSRLKPSAATSPATSSAIAGGQRLITSLALGDELANGPDVAKRRGALRVAALRPSLAQSTSPATADPTSAPISPGKRSPTRVTEPSSRTQAPARLAESQQPPTEGWDKGARGAMRNSSRQVGSPLIRCAPIAAISVSSSPPSPRERSCSPHRRRAR